MIRNRSQVMIASTCNDIESNVGSDGKTSSPSRMLGGSKRWQYFAMVLLGGVIIYILLLVGGPAPLKEHKPSKETSHEQLTIVMNTFKRHDMMTGTASVSL